MSTGLTVQSRLGIEPCITCTRCEHTTDIAKEVTMTGKGQYTQHSPAKSVLLVERHTQQHFQGLATKQLLYQQWESLQSIPPPHLDSRPLPLFSLSSWIRLDTSVRSWKWFGDDMRSNCFPVTHLIPKCKYLKQQLKRQTNTLEWLHNILLWTLNLASTYQEQHQRKTDETKERHPGNAGLAINNYWSFESFFFFLPILRF